MESVNATSNSTRLIGSVVMALLSCSSPAPVDPAGPSTTRSTASGSALNTSAVNAYGSVYKLAALKSGQGDESQVCFWGQSGQSGESPIVLSFDSSFEIQRNPISVTDNFTGNSASIGSPVQVFGGRTGRVLRCDGQNMQEFLVSTIGTP